MIPKDGLRTSQRPPGRIATRWLAVLEGLDERLKGRLLRGKTIARSGRVREIEIAPGIALAVVQDGEVAKPAVRVRTFDESEWATVIDTLRGQLSLLAKLFEGEVADELLTALDERKVPLVPHPGEINGDCDCGDWEVPCAHSSALHHVLSEALDGEPFQLFTLRGRTREQLLSELKRSWGDTPSAQDIERAPVDSNEHDGDPFASPTPAPLLSFRFHGVSPAPAMLELGPLAGDEDLHRALVPLYDAGAGRAVAIALAESGLQESLRRRRGRSAVPGPMSRAPLVTKPPQSISAMPSVTKTTPAPKPRAERAKKPKTQDLTEAIVDLLAESDEGATVEQLAERLKLPIDRARAELGDLLSLGLVASSDDRWYLG